jgi:hypothetical protein
MHERSGLWCCGWPVLWTLSLSTDGVCAVAVVLMVPSLEQPTCARFSACDRNGGGCEESLPTNTFVSYYYYYCYYYYYYYYYYTHTYTHQRTPVIARLHITTSPASISNLLHPPPYASTPVHTTPPHSPYNTTLLHQYAPAPPLPTPHTTYTIHHPPSTFGPHPPTSSTSLGVRERLREGGASAALVPGEPNRTLRRPPQRSTHVLLPSQLRLSASRAQERS